MNIDELRQHDTLMLLALRLDFIQNGWDRWRQLAEQALDERGVDWKAIDAKIAQSSARGSQ